MFCPQCKREYREGSYVCSNCQVELVAELPPEPNIEEYNCDPELFEFEQILYTYNVTDMITIKTILQAAGIAFFFNGEFWVGIPQLAEPARLMVRKDHAEDAKNLLKDLQLTFMGFPWQGTIESNEHEH
jgi:hypothetical protein